MYTINVNYNKTQTDIRYEPKENKTLASILIKHNIPLNTPCGGNGTCGKCIVEVCDGNNTFNTPACRYYPSGNIRVNIPESSYTQSPDLYNEIQTNKKSLTQGDATVSADIGSTSISICLSINNAPADIYTFPNPTIPYGADIISRIQSCISGNTKTLSLLLRSGINNAIALLLRRNKVNPTLLKQVIISCNNTMQHILFGLDCAPLSAYPFKSQNTVFKTRQYNRFFNTDTAHESFMDNCTATIHTISSFASFIGGDIVSGLYSLEPFEPQKTFLFLDLGTNAEMVLGTGAHMICTSAAAGPAFEAASLSCGCAYSPGAIYDITINAAKSGNYNIKYKTIQNKIPTGICGSGILKLISQMLNTGIIDSYGTLLEEYSRDGFLVAKSSGHNIRITQKDIREIQLAISAIRTGIDILLQKTSLSASDIDTVYISGSFGSALNFYDIQNLNILKPEWLNNPETIKISGNTSLNGAIKYSYDKFADFKINNLISRLEEIILAGDDSFNSLFMDNINFSI